MVGRGVRPLRAGREGVRRRRRRAPASTSPRWTVPPLSGSPASRCRATTRWSTELPHTPTGRLAKHRLPSSAPPEVDMENTSPCRWTTDVAASTSDRLGHARCHHRRPASTCPSEVMGRLSLTELAYLLVVGREPTPGERRLLDAVLVSLADHGLTPSALAARLTYTGAPEAIQGAVAAGLLGAGSVFLGPAGDTARVPGRGPAPSRRHRARRRRAPCMAEAVVAPRRAAGRGSRGSAIPSTATATPAPPRLYELAEEEGLLGPHLRLLTQVAEAHEGRRAGRCRSTGPVRGRGGPRRLGVPPDSRPRRSCSSPAPPASWPNWPRRPATRSAARCGSRSRAAPDRFWSQQRAPGCT